MKQKVFFLFVIFTTNIVNGQDFNYQTDFKKLVEQSKDNKSDNYYIKLKSEFIENGENFSKEKVIALMAGQTASEFYNAYGMIELERNYQNADKFPSDTIYKHSKDLLQVYPTNFSLNYGLWKTYEKDADIVNAKKFEERFKLIAESILSTGNGTIEKPYFVISPIDGQVLIKLYFRKTIGMMGSGRDKEGNFIDILDMVDGDNSKTLNFIIDHSMKLFREELKENEGKEIENKYELDENGKVILKTKE
jgi:Domain of unknown function (DUF4919)